MTQDNPLKDFQRQVSEAIREGKPAPDADVVDEEKYSYLKRAGDNKSGLTVCATCGKPPTTLNVEYQTRGLPEKVFMFVDELSAREYYISGMCQDCQNDVFSKENEK